MSPGVGRLVNAQSVAASSVSDPLGSRESEPVSDVGVGDRRRQRRALDEAVGGRADQRPLDRSLVGERVEHDLVDGVEERDAVGRAVVGIDRHDAELRPRGPRR